MLLKPNIYIPSFFLITLAAFLIFRIFVRNDYRRYSRLTLFSAILQWVIFGLWTMFAFYDAPSDWPPLDANITIATAGLILSILGVSGLFMLIITFGLRRTSGTKVNTLIQSGLYRFTRNPQLVVGGLGVVGYVLVFQSWHALFVAILFAIIAHLMVLAEEEHLYRIFGKEYTNYCKRVPRYIGLPKV